MNLNVHSFNISKIVLSFQNIKYFVIFFFLSASKKKKHQEQSPPTIKKIWKNEEKITYFK